MRRCTINKGRNVPSSYKRTCGKGSYKSHANSAGCPEMENYVSIKENYMNLRQTVKLMGIILAAALALFACELPTDEELRAYDGTKSTGTCTAGSFGVTISMPYSLTVCIVARTCSTSADKGQPKATTSSSVIRFSMAALVDRNPSAAAFA